MQKQSPNKLKLHINAATIAMTLCAPNIYLFVVVVVVGFRGIDFD